MLEIDPNRTWQLLDERLKTETNPLHRAHLETMIYHQKGEAAGDIDQILSTLSPKSQYLVYDVNRSGPPRVFDGIAGARDWYNELLGFISVDLEYRIERLVVDDYCVVTEGPTRIALQGTMLQKIGVEVSDKEAFYLHEGRNIVFWPFNPEDNLLLGEQIYSVGTTPMAKAAERKLQPEQIGRYLKAA